MSDKILTVQLMDKICAWAESRDDIRVLIMTGSHARGQADDLSDLDLELFTRRPEWYTRSDEWMNEIGAVSVYLALYEGRGLPTRLIIFHDGLKADFTICGVDLLADMVTECRVPPLYERGYRVLVDKDQMARGLARGTQRPETSSPPTEDQFTGIVREFWFEACQVAKYLKRGDLWTAKSRDTKLKELLLCVLQWHEKSIHGWDLDTMAQVKDWVTPEMWHRLGGLFGSGSV